MKIIYNTKKLNQILEDLSIITGISIAFLDKNYNRICGSVKANDFCETIQSSEELRKKCCREDEKILNCCNESRQFECHICFAGLYDAALPVTINGDITGFLIMGRVRSSKSPKDCICSSDKKTEALYKELPFFSDRQLASLRTLLPNILFSDAISLEKDELIEKIDEYIMNNLASDLSVYSICKNFFISKNHLYKCIKTAHGTTVNEYITSLRIEKAKKLLIKTRYPVYSICEIVGIDNYTYFCKLFKKLTGMTPSGLRKQEQSKKY